MMIEATPQGLYCPAGDFHIDPWRKVDRAVITHAHSDHARSGMGAYLTSPSGVGVLRERVGAQAVIEALPWEKPVTIGHARVSLHPAGHVLGSAQVQVEVGGERWVVTGDYKTQPDRSCEAFAPVACHTLITESTFGLPIYRWPAFSSEMEAVHDWWRKNREQGRTSVLFAYALGKAQRLLCGLDAEAGPIGVHGSVEKFLPHYREWEKPIPPCIRANRDNRELLRGKGLIIAPGSTQNSDWLSQFAPCSLAFASGWMQVRGVRRRLALDRGFVVSDHADWGGLVDTIRASGASRVGVTHGDSGPMVRWLREQGYDAWEVPTRFQGEAQSGGVAGELQPPAR